MNGAENQKKKKAQIMDNPNTSGSKKYVSDVDYSPKTTERKKTQYDYFDFYEGQKS